MLTFRAYLEEKLITLNNQAYPPFGHAVILAGGAGSGKGFVISHLLGIRGRILDVDELKKLALQGPTTGKRIQAEFGKPVDQINLKDPEDVRRLHGVIANTMSLVKKRDAAVIKSIQSVSKDRLPNLIFDVTLDDISKVAKLSGMLDSMGYQPNNIHIVWVLTDYETAVVQNKERPRIVPDDIMFQTHAGAATTMGQILKKSARLPDTINGDIWIAFNTRGVDTKSMKSDLGGMFVTDASLLKIKSAGSSQIRTLTQQEQQKIASYIPV